MKNSRISVIALIIAMIMILGSFAACSGGGEQSSSSSSEATSKTEETSKEKESNDSESSSQITDETSGETTEEITEDQTEEDTTPKLEGENALLIENADRLKNDITSYFQDAARNYYTVINNNMQLDYILTSEEAQLATLKNKKGGTYIENTMDVFIKMKSGKTYYASGSQNPATANLFRYGYYYYDTHFYNQNFVNDISILDEQAVKLAQIRTANSMSKPKIEDDGLHTSITNSVDPYISGTGFKISAEKYNALRITLKTDSTSTVNLFFVAGSYTNFSEDQRIDFYPIADGEFHTYTIPLNSDTLKDYTGTLSQIRFDFNGSVGDNIVISELTALSIKDDGAPAIIMDRNLHVYSDKMHQVIRLFAEKDQSDIDSIGMITKVAADTVDKLVVKDKSGVKYSIDNVDWDSAEYVGFDIKNVGIFGYILPVEKFSGKLTVTLEEGNYVITQTTAPEGGKILAPIPASSNKDKVVIDFKGQSNDPYHSVNEFDFGQRIYTDSTHSFDAFLHEAFCERNPLTAENIQINKEKTPKATFDGYDALRGIYCFTTPDTTGFNTAYYNHPNKHCQVSFSIKGDDKDRDIYVLAYAFTTSLECSAVLDKNDMMLPIPIEVSKNFSNEFEEPMFAWGDIRYGEARIPMVIKAGETEELSILHLYQNWGNYPLKQISSIQFFSPYYHLSTGCTESNCISSYYVYGKDLQMLPDHRAMSAPMWPVDPQHTNGGIHNYLQYTDADGSYYATENIYNILETAGPTYSDLALTYLSDDGKIKVTYTHMEFPQLDENRAFYTMTYEILEDISFKDFAKDFSFYSVRGLNGDYMKVGYLDEKNNPAVVNSTNDGKDHLYKLGNIAPYFDMFLISEKDPAGKDFVNVSFLVKDASFIIGGKEADPAFVIVENRFTTRLSLDLGEVTFKKGDKMTINSIIMPWGSHQDDYTTSAPDINVRKVRENSILDPLKATAGANAEIIDSVWLPKIKTTNGKSAEFTLSGGENNVAFRVYGFEMLTAPKIYEKVDGEWVLIDVSSLNNPDKEGNAHAYDGYTVHYDGDGTFSYSFITTLTGDQTRTFKVVADEKFEGWPEQNIVVEDPVDIYFDPNEIAISANKNNLKTEILDDGSYIRVFGDGSSPEKYMSFDVSTDSGITGQYAVIKYRIPTTNDTSPDHFQIYTGTKSSTIIGKGDWLVSRSIATDGQWHVMVINIAAFNLPEFEANADGSYTAKYFRFDIFNAKMSESSYVDVAYIAMCASVEEAISFNKDVLSVDLVESENGSKKIYTATGSSDPSAEDLLNIYIGPDSLKAANVSGAGKLEYITEGNISFARYWGNGSSPEAFSSIYTGGSKVSGKYVVIKYRIPTTNKENPDNSYIEFFTSTVNSGPMGYGPESDYAATLGQKLLIKDDQWHTLVIDVTSYSTCTTFLPADDGSYTAKFIRFDMFNGQPMSADSYMDVAFVGMCEDPTPFLDAE